MLISDDIIRDYLRKRLRGNIIKFILGGKSFWLKSGHNLYEKNPYDKRLIKAIIIQLLGIENKEVYDRCEEDKSIFISYRSIKS